MNIESYEHDRLTRLAEGYEVLARAECRRLGVDPDEVIADGGHMAWQLVGHEACERERGQKRSTFVA